MTYARPGVAWPPTVPRVEASGSYRFHIGAEKSRSWRQARVPCVQVITGKRDAILR